MPLGSRSAMAVPSAHHRGSGWLQTTRREPQGHSYPVMAPSLCPECAGPRAGLPQGAPELQSASAPSFVLRLEPDEMHSPGSSAQLVPVPPLIPAVIGVTISFQRSPQARLWPRPRSGWKLRDLPLGFQRARRARLAFAAPWNTELSSCS